MYDTVCLWNVSSMNPKEEKWCERRKRQDVSLFYRLSTRRQTKSQLQLTGYISLNQIIIVFCVLFMVRVALSQCNLIFGARCIHGLFVWLCGWVPQYYDGFIIMISAASDENPSFDLICDKHTIVHQPHMWVWTHPLGKTQLVLLWMSYDFNFLSFSIQDSSAHQNALKKRC